MFWDQERVLRFLDVACIDNYFWVSALEWNGYYKLDRELGTAEFVGIFEHADAFAYKLFWKILECHKSLFFIPWFFDYLVWLDTETLVTKYWKLPESVVAETAKFRAAYLFEGKIYMFPMYGEEICIFDIKKEQFECKKIWMPQSKEYIKVTGDFMQGCQIGNKVYLPSLCRNSIFEFELRNNRYKWISITEEPITDIVKCSEDELLMLSFKGNVWKYHLCNNQSELIYSYDGKINWHPYKNILLQNGNLYLMPAKEENILILKKGQAVKMQYPVGWEKQHTKTGIASIFNGYYKDEKKVMVYPCLGNMLLEIGEDGMWKGNIYYDDIIKWEREVSKKEFILEEYKTGIKILFDILKYGKENVASSIEKTGDRIWHGLVGEDKYE